MRLLAIETVDKTGSVAAFDGEKLLAEQRLDPARRSAQTLVPAIESLLRQVGWRPAEVELVGVATGPGSFTGLRIGVTTAKTFAYVTGCQVLGVHSMLAIGARVPATESQFHAAIDAQRNELFVAQLTRGLSGELQGEASTRVVPAESWLAELPPQTVVTGPGLSKYAATLRADLQTIDRELWAPTAASVGTIAWQLFQAGQRDNLLQLCPRYVRRTAAEEQWERKLGQAKD